MESAVLTRRGAGLTCAFLILAVIVVACTTKVTVCPAPYVLDQTGTLMRFAPGAPPGPQSLDFQADMSVKAMTCAYKDDLATELEVNLDIEIAAVRGPANTSGEAEFEYFVAITDVRGTVLNKEVFDMDMDLGEPGSTTKAIEGIWQQYRMLKGQSGKAYRIWLGFQMTERDLEIQRQLTGK